MLTGNLEGYALYDISPNTLARVPGLDFGPKNSSRNLHCSWDQCGKSAKRCWKVATAGRGEVRAHENWARLRMACPGLELQFGLMGIPP